MYDTDTKRPVVIKRMILWEANLHGPLREQHLDEQEMHPLKWDQKVAHNLSHRTI